MRAGPVTARRWPGREPPAARRRRAVATARRPGLGRTESRPYLDSISAADPGQARLASAVARLFDAGGEVIGRLGLQRGLDSPAVPILSGMRAAGVEVAP